MVKPKYDHWNSLERINSMQEFGIISINEPWDILKPNVDADPEFVIFNNDMTLSHLEKVYKNVKSSLSNNFTIIGIGGGSPCDTAKYLVWKHKNESDEDLDLILIPSIISVDAFLCSSIAVRVDGKVNYIGKSDPKEILIDYELIKSAPKYLNRAGVSDTISITSALGDWKIAHDEINEPLNLSVFNRAKNIAKTLMQAREDIKNVNDRGIKAMVDGFYEEVQLCEKWGNARPEEGSEHFLAYCLESITREHYIHGNLIGLNVLISLYLQGEYAEFKLDEIHAFLNHINLNYKPEDQNIKYVDIQKALLNIRKYVNIEDLFYSVYNSPKLKLNKTKIKEIIGFIKTL